MKKLHFLLFVILIAVTGLTLISCRQKQAPTDTRTEFEKYISEEDSLAVIDLVEQFFFYAENGNYAEAAAMLHKVDVDSVYNEPQLLSNEEMKEVIVILKTLGIQGHRIDYIKFRESYLNEVKCTAILFPATDTTPEASTSIYFKPVDFINSWALCLMHSTTGDDPFVSEDEKAQLTSEFEADQKARAQKQAETEEALKAQSQDSEQPE